MPLLRLFSDTRPPLWPAAVPPFKSIPRPPMLLVPLPTSAAIPPGTQVKEGYPLVETISESSHVPLAPIAGIVGETRQVTRTGGQSTWAVELRTDPASADPPVPSADASPTASRFAPRGSAEAPPMRTGELVHWVEWLRANGIYARRHASPPLIDQLNAAIQRPPHTVICTVLDADPLLRLQATVAARRAYDLAEAVALLAKLTAARRAWVIVERGATKPWIEPVQLACKAAGVTLISLPNDYPQADPSLLLYTLLDRRLHPGRSPTEQGALVIDAPTAVAIGQCLHRRWPMRTVPFGVLDHNSHRAEFLDVPIGTPLSFVLEHLGMLNADGPETVIRGGDMLRDVLIPPDAVIAASELTAHVMARPEPVIPHPCLRCGWCLQACPTRIHPARMLEAAQCDDTELAEHAGITSCIECGICSHVCPSQLPLLPAIRTMKAKMLKPDLAIP